MAITIKSGAKVFYQWERGVELTATTPCDILRVSREDDRATVDLYPVINGSTGTVKLPDRMLTESGYLHISRIDTGDGTERVLETARFLIRHAAKPKSSAAATKEVTDMLALKMQMAAFERAAREGKFDGITPHIGANGNWYLGDTDTGVRAAGEDGITPHIGENGNWYAGDVDLGVPARGDKGDTPYVGENGNWWIGDTDTGVPTSQGSEQIRYLYTNGVIVGEDEDALLSAQTDAPSETELAHQTQAGAVFINGIIKWIDSFTVTYASPSEMEEYAVGFRFHEETREIEQKVWRIRKYTLDGELRYENLDEDGALLPVREGGVYDILIAYIQIPAGATGTGFWVDDLRGDESVCGFVNSKVHDFEPVKKQAKNASDAISDIIGSGVLGEDAFVMEAQAGSMKIITSPGVAYINGIRRELKKSTRTYAVPTNDRVTVQLLRLDEAEGEIGYAVWKDVIIDGDIDNGGTITDSSTGEQLPLRSGGYYDLILCIVSLPAGAAEVTQDMIRDLRGDERYCGFVRSKICSGSVAEITADMVTDALGYTPADEREVPTKTSELENDSEFVTADQLEGLGGGAAKNVWYGTCLTGGTTAAKVVTTSTGDFALEKGNVVYVAFSGYAYDNSTLNVDGTGAKTIITTSVQTTVTKVKTYQWDSGETIAFVYDGTYFRMIDGAIASTSKYGMTKLSSSTTSTSKTEAATPSAVKQAYDLATTANTAAGEAKTLAEGAQPKGDYALRSEIPDVPVKSVNGKTGDVNLTASDVGAAATEQVAELSEAIAESVVTGKVYLDESEFTRGSWYSGDIGQEQYRIRSIETIGFDYDVLLSAVDGFRFFGYYVKEDGTKFNGTGWITTLKLPAATRFYITIARVEEDNTETADIGEYIRAVPVLSENTAKIVECTTVIEKNKIAIDNHTTAMAFCLESLMENQNAALHETGAIAATASAISTSNLYACNPGDTIEYTLSADRGIFATYDKDGNLNQFVAGTGYSNYISDVYTFTEQDAYFRVSGSIARYNSGYYTLKYNSKFTRYEKISEDVDALKEAAEEVKKTSQENTQKITEIAENTKETIKHNDVYYANGVMRRCYNPYKNGGSQFWVGQMHCHDKTADEDGSAIWAGTESHIETANNYRNAGYDWFTLTNYSHLNEISHIDDSDMPEGLTWLCDSLEVPVRAGTDSDGNAEMIKHICVYNTGRMDGWHEYVTLDDFASITKDNGAVISLAHPYWSSTYAKPETLAKVSGRVRFCEVWDGAVEYYRETGLKGDNYTTYPEGKYSDYAWEVLLDNGCITWGTAISDVHSGLETSGVFKRGCVKVFANNNERFEIFKNLCSGNFYASSHIDKSLTSLSFENGIYTIGTGSASAVTYFIKETGIVCATITGETATYTMDGSEKYIRAVVLYDTGEVDYLGEKIYEKIWTQPVINIFKPDYDNYFDFSLAE